MTDIEDIPVNKSIDCKGMLCPLPVFHAAKAMNELSPGEVLEVLCTDPGSLADFPAFARQTGHELLISFEENGAQIFRLRKGPA